MKIIGKTLRIVIYLIVAVASLLTLIFLQPAVKINKYAEDEAEKSDPNMTNYTEDANLEPDSSNWTTSTMGHKIALAVADALAPKGTLDEDKIPSHVFGDEEENNNE